MNEHEQQDINMPADEQLRRALGGVAGIFEQMFRRNDECRAEIEQIRVRHNQDVARMAALEMELTSDRTAIQQMGSVFAGIAQRANLAPPAAPAPATTASAPSAVSLLPPAAEHGAHQQQHTGEPSGHSARPCICGARRHRQTDVVADRRRAGRVQPQRRAVSTASAVARTRIWRVRKSLRSPSCASERRCRSAARSRGDWTRSENWCGVA